jgi:hypothetical protein
MTVRERVMSASDQTDVSQASRWYRKVDWIVVEIVVTSIVCGVAIRSWWVGLGLFVVFYGLNSRPDGRRSLATLSAFCWIGLGTTLWTRVSGLGGGLFVGLAAGGAIFLAHSLAPAPVPAPPPETKAEMHKAQVEHAARDVLVIAMILLALFGFFWVGAAPQAAVDKSAVSSASSE